MLACQLAVEAFTSGRAHELLALRLGALSMLETDATLRWAYAHAACAFWQGGTC